MCGIAGILDLKGRRSIDRSLLQRMNQRLLHRGPDGGEIMTLPGLGLAHRRLAIIDLAGGIQPMSDPEGRITVTFNGEIYNYRELMRELEAKGFRFRTKSDTEVLIHGWIAWGEGLVERLRGMFAFALWDAGEERLFLARDRLGKKPLYWGLDPEGRLCFASELGALLAAWPERPALDPFAVEEYFAFGYVPDPRSIYRGIFKLPPASTLLVTRGSTPPEPRTYWEPRFFSRPAGKPATVSEELLARLDEAVKLRLIADVPLGAFLSGGVDSSGIVALMAAGSDRPVETCSIGFSEAAYDESDYARQVAERFGTRHFTRRVDLDALSLIDRLARAYSEPFADSSALPTYLLAGLARERVTVALSGDGGDEVFAGYRRYAYHLREEQTKRFLPDPIRRPLFSAAAAAYPKLDWAPRWLRAKATFEALAEDAVGGYFRAVTIAPTPLRHDFLSADLLGALGGYEAIEVLRHHARRTEELDPVSRVQLLDLKTWLPGAMLTKVDRASMAQSLEVRCPLLDHELVDWAGGLALQDKVRGLEGKVALKRALEPYLPHEILYRPKQGFSIPLASWFRGALGAHLEAAIDGPHLGQSGLFDLEKLRLMQAAHRSGRSDFSRPLWAMVMFDAFLRDQASLAGMAGNAAAEVA